MSEEMKSASLRFTQGGSDKVYNCGVRKAMPEGTFIVVATWGRYGQTLQVGQKCKPTTLAEAEACFTKVVKEKIEKGYKPAIESEESIPAAVVAFAEDVAKKNPSTPVYLPQLLNSISEGQAQALMRNPHIGAQRKYDGVRRILIKRGDQVTSLNKKGIQRAIATEIADYAKQVKGDFVMDGEAIGPDFYAFDLLERDGEDLRSLAYGTRYNALLKIIGGPNGWPIHPVPMAIGEKQIRKYLADLRNINAEGIVFKDLLAPYVAGDKHEAQWKLKFVATCSAIVVAQNEQRSVALALYNEKREGIGIGNVTIPPNHPVPAPGSVVECRYLNWIPGGALYQPVYLGTREDVSQEECTFERQQLKTKEGVK